MKRAVTLLAAASLLGVATSALAQEPAAATGERLSQDEVIYFVLPDRFANGDPANDTGGYPADRLKSGYDPTHRGFYHGGDLKGLTEKLDYIQGLGITAIWFNENEDVLLKTLATIVVLLIASSIGIALAGGLGSSSANANRES